MGTNRQGLLDKLTALETRLRSELGIDSNDLMSSTCSLGREDVEKLSPPSIANLFGEMMVLDHIGDLQLLYHDMSRGPCILFCDLEMEITALPLDLEMSVGRATSSFAAPVTPLLATGYRTLFAPQGFLQGAVIARVLYRVALTIRQERCETHIKADIGMLTHGWQMRSRWLCFTDDSRIPMPISTMNQMHRPGGSLYRTMQLDLEEVSQLLRHDEMFLIFMHIAVFAILPQLERVPTVRFLETREPDIRDVLLLGGKEPLERLGEPICKHLYRGSRHMLASLTFESLFQIILTGERALVLILLFDHLKHRIIDRARLSQASHEETGLCLIWVQAILECFHVLYYSSIESVCQQFRPPAGGRQFTHMAEASGPLAAFLVVFPRL